MSERNGDRARFQKTRTRKLRNRRRIRELAASHREQPAIAAREARVVDGGPTIPSASGTKQ